MVGAYYFDGWTGRTDKYHLTKLLQTEFANRKPVWGWYDNTVEIMQQQIDYCRRPRHRLLGLRLVLSRGTEQGDPAEQRAGLYLKTPNRDRLKFCLLEVNHAGFRIGPKDWDACCRIWIDLFRQPTYLRLDGQPLLIFFDPRRIAERLWRRGGRRQGVRIVAGQGEAGRTARRGHCRL